MPVTAGVLEWTAEVSRALVLGVVFQARVLIKIRNLIQAINLLLSLKFVFGGSTAVEIV